MATARAWALPFFLLTLLIAPRADADRCPSFAPGSEGLPVLVEWRTHPALGDLNGDGHLDLAAHPRKDKGPRVWLGNGRGQWKDSSRGLALPGMGCGVGVDLADVDGDGDLDLGVADHCHGLYVFTGDGQGRWRPSDAGRLGEAAGYEDLQFGDVDGDGDVDLLAGGAFAAGFTLLLGDGKGGWTRADRGLPTDGFVRDLKLGDINHDGRLDLVSAFSSNRVGRDSQIARHNPVWISDAEGRYHPASEGLPVDRQTRGVALGDVDGDGNLDLGLSLIPRSEEEPPLRVYLGDGAGGWKPASRGLPEPGLRVPTYMGIEFADLNADGNPDLVASSFSDARLHVWIGDGSGGWQACRDTGLPEGREGVRGWGVVVGDVNGDGRPDLASGFGRQGSGGIEVWLQTPNAAAPASPSAGVDGDR